MNGLQIKLSTIFTFTAEIPYNSLLFSMLIDEFELGSSIVIAKNSRDLRVNSTFLPPGKHADAMAAGSTWTPRAGDTVKCQLDAG